METHSQYLHLSCVLPLPPLLSTQGCWLEGQTRFLGKQCVWLFGFLFDLRMVPFGLTKNCLLSMCVFVQSLGSASCMVTSPHLSVSSASRYTSLFLRLGRGLGPSLGYLVLEGHRPSQMRLPYPFPLRSTQNFPFGLPRRSCHPISGWSLGLMMRHLFSPPSPVWEGHIAQGQQHAFQDSNQETP